VKNDGTGQLRCRSKGAAKSAFFSQFVIFQYETIAVCVDLRLCFAFARVCSFVCSFALTLFVLVCLLFVFALCFGLCLNRHIHCFHTLFSGTVCCAVITRVDGICR